MPRQFSQNALWYYCWYEKDHYSDFLFHGWMVVVVVMVIKLIIYLVSALCWSLLHLHWRTHSRSISRRYISPQSINNQFSHHHIINKILPSSKIIVLIWSWSQWFMVYDRQFFVIWKVGFTLRDSSLLFNRSMTRSMSYDHEWRMDQ